MTAYIYTKRNGDVIYISYFAVMTFFLTLTVLAIALLTWGNNRAKETRTQEFLYEFNNAVSPELQQDDIKAIKSIAPGYWLEAEEWAVIWNFAHKYNINEFPKYNGDMHTQQSISKNLVTQLKAADEYIENNHIDKATASRLLNQAFAITNGNLVAILEPEKS